MIKPLVPGNGIYTQLPTSEALHIPSGNLTDGVATINIATIASGGGVKIDYVANATGAGPYPLTRSVGEDVAVFKSGAPQIDTVDFTISGNQITFIGAGIPNNEHLLFIY